MQVICSCNHERVDTTEVEFLNIEEGPAGEDRLTFVCPFCGEDHTSVVFAGGHAYPESVGGDAAYWNDVEATAESACQCYE